MSRVVEYNEGQKLLRRFHVMNLYCEVDIPISLPLCTPTPFPPNKCCVLNTQVFLQLKTKFIRGWGGGGDLRGFNRIIWFEIVGLSARFRQMCQLLLSLIAKSDVVAL